MKKIFYEKVGRRYKPVYEYDTYLMDAYPKGSHVVICYPGGKSIRYNIEPEYAPLVAAARVAEDAIASAISRAGEIRLQRKDRERRLTPEQKAAWEHLVEVFGDSAKQLEWASVRECAEAGAKALQEEAEVLLSNPTVRAAYDQFIMLAELSKQEKQND